MKLQWKPLIRMYKHFLTSEVSLEASSEYAVDDVALYATKYTYLKCIFNSNFVRKWRSYFMEFCVS